MLFLYNKNINFYERKILGMNKKFMSTFAIITALSGSLFHQVKAVPKRIVHGKYSGQVRVEGLTPNFDVRNAHTLIGKTIDSKSELYKQLEKLDSEYCNYYYQALDLSKRLFESAKEKDRTEHWRERDCVNFDFNAYISCEPDTVNLIALWEQVDSLKTRMLLIIKSYLEYPR